MQVHNKYRFTTSTDHNSAGSQQVQDHNKCRITTSTGSQQVQDHNKCRITTSTGSQQVQDHNKYRITTSTGSQQVQDHNKYRITTSTEDAAWMSSSVSCTCTCPDLREVSGGMQKEGFLALLWMVQRKLSR